MRLEALQLMARSRETRHDRSNGDAGRSGDLFVRELLKRTHDEDLTKRGRK
jgi:hypothetical protein